MLSISLDSNKNELRSINKRLHQLNNLIVETDDILQDLMNNFYLHEYQTLLKRKKQILYGYN